MVQGRCEWHNPTPQAEDAFEEEEDDDEEKEQPEEVEPETGPQILTSVSEDSSKQSRVWADNNIIFIHNLYVCVCNPCVVILYWL